MKVRKKPSNTSIYNTTNFDYKATYTKLRKNKNIRSLCETQKGHIACWLKQPEAFIEISPKGKVIIYYDQYDDCNQAIRILIDSDEKLVVCESFSIEQEILRTLKSEGIEANLADLIEPELLQRLNYDNYILHPASPKTSKALAEGIRNYLTNLTERFEYNRALEEMENTSQWIVTFGTTVTRKILTRSGNYVKACDRLTQELTSALRESLYGFNLLEGDRDGEGLSLRYGFVWRPADGPLKLPPYPKIWEILELDPFKLIYPDSDLEDV